MRHRWQTLTILLVLWLAPDLLLAQCAEQIDGVAALADARKARGVVSDLALMRAWTGDLTRDIDEINERHGTLFDPAELGMRHATAWLWWSDSFSGFRLCDSDTPVDLDRQWWGAQAYVMDYESGLGFELFYLTASDELGFAGELEDYEYGWRHRIAGAQLRYKDWAALRVGTIDIEAPSRSGDGVHDGSAFLALSVPRIGLGADLLMHPGSRRVDMLMLGVRRTRLPFGGMTLSANGGWLDDEQKGIVGFGLTAAGDAIAAQLVFEGLPVRMRSVSFRVESIHQHFFDDDVWLKVGFAPYVEVSAYDGSVFRETTGRSLIPGAATGCRAFFNFGILSTGIEGFVGVNRATELSRLPSIADHLQWGGRFFVRLGI